jgi:hypothetical protein
MLPWRPHILTQDYYHSDLMPENAYGMAEQQLLFAASHAWVFGGMGSWNDMGFEDKQVQHRYETVSSALMQRSIMLLLL